jgi:fructose-1,6-bisphosphatase
MVSEEDEEPIVVSDPAVAANAKYILVFDPLDGSR